MNNPMQWILVLVTSLLLAACTPAAVRDPASPFYQVPVGSQIILHQPLEIRPGHTRVFIQRGEVTRFKDLDQYWPHCNFEVRYLLQEPQQIVPDRFTVERVQQGQTEIVGRPHVQVAALNLLAFSRDGGGPPSVARYYDLWLSSEQQPDVMRLRCFDAMDDLPRANLPRYRDIEATLGAIATIEPRQ